MTDPIVSLESDRLSVEPGGQVSVTVKITNPGNIVEGYRVEVVGEGVAGWGEVLPPDVSVYPKQDASAVVVFSPPGGTGAPGGTWPFGVRVRSTEDADASAVVEGDLEIGKVFGLQAKLVPVNSSGRWRGRHVVQLTNWGNSPAKITLTATNPDDALAFMIRPEVVELPLGGTASAMVWVKTKKPFLRGTPVRLPFTIAGEPVGAAPQQAPALPYGGTPERPSVDGALNQKPIVSRGAVMVGALALLAVGGGIVFALTRPQPAQASFAELGPPAQPKNVTVAAASPESVNVKWDPVPDIEGYTVVQELDGGAQTNALAIPGTDNAKTIGSLTPGTKVCFKVRAERGKTPGPFSDQQCANLPAASASASPGQSPTSAASSPGAGQSSAGNPNNPVNPVNPVNPNSPGQTGASNGTPGSPSSAGSSTGPSQDISGKWFAAAIFPTIVVFDPQEKLREVKRAGPLPSGLVLNTAYPTLRLADGLPLQGPTSWVLYVGPVASQADANAACAQIRPVYSTCQAIQLQP